jgi:hypothetical protein
MGQKAVEVIQIWTETEGFKRKKKDQLVYEPLPAVIALATKLGHTEVLEGLRKVPLHTIPVSEAAYAELVSLLDAPPKPNERLRRALQTPAPWEK